MLYLNVTIKKTVKAKEVDTVRQENIIHLLNLLFEIKTTRQTIARYEEQGLIPKADRSSKGLPGRSAIYPAETIEQFVASNRLLTGKYGDPAVRYIVGENLSPIVSPNAIAEARRRILHNEQIMETNDDMGPTELERSGYARNAPDSQIARMFMMFLSYAWAYERELAREKI